MLRTVEKCSHQESSRVIKSEGEKGTIQKHGVEKKRENGSREE